MANGELSLAEMRRRILAGNVISYRGRIIKRVEDLPKESEHAVTLEEKIARAKVLAREINEREQEYDQLMSEIRKLQQPKVDTAADAGQPQPPTNTVTVPQPPLSPVIPSPTNDANVNPAPGTADAAVTPAPATNAAAVTPTPTNGTTAKVTAGTEEPKFAKKPLSYWRDLADGAESDDAAKQRFVKIKDVTPELADQILKAVKGE